MQVSNYSAGGTGLTAPGASANTVTFNSTPNAAGTVSFDLLATDTVGATAAQHYSFTINVGGATIVFADDFSRADSPTLGSNWTTQAGSVGIRSSAGAYSPSAVSLA